MVSFSSFFLCIPEDVWCVVAEFSVPVDIYNLSLSHPAFSLPSITGKPLATSLLNNSLLQNLERVWKGRKSAQFKCDKGLLSFSRLCRELPTNSLVMCGSSIAQSIVGDVWENTEIDFVCSYSVSRVVRSWLHDQMGQLLVGYDEVFHKPCSNPRNSLVSHVEYYKAIPRDGTPMYMFDGMDYVDSRPRCFTYAAACVRGRKNGGYKRLPSMRTVRTVMKGGRAIPYQSLESFGHRRDKGMINIELVIAKPGVAVKEVLDTFDINVRRSTYNGKQFKIVDPVRSFTKRTKMTNDHLSAFVELYVEQILIEAKKDFLSLVEAYYSSPFVNEYSRLIPQELHHNDLHRLKWAVRSAGTIFSPDLVVSCSTLRCVILSLRWNMIHMTLLRLESQVIEHDGGDMIWSCNGWRSMCPLEKHNSIIRAIAYRANKYISRGFEIENVPEYYPIDRQVLRKLQRFI